LLFSVDFLKIDFNDAYLNKIKIKNKEKQSDGCIWTCGSGSFAYFDYSNASNKNTKSIQ
jgi:hypothetical protein